MKPKLDLDEDALGQRYEFAKLVRPSVGLVDSVLSLRQAPTSPPFEVGTASLGNLMMSFPHVSSVRGAATRDTAIGGSGADVSAELAWVRAVVEAAERYCTSVHSHDDFVVASADELGDDAMDLSTVPRLSEREYADPACPFVPPDSARPIRWTRAYSLLDRRLVFVPSIMTHLYLAGWPEESFWQPISTGCAAHTDLTAALLAAICEVVERDAIALTWLCRLPLPEILIDDTSSEALRSALDRLDQGLVEHRFFDATTDVGVPTVYSVQLLAGDPTLSQLVACAVDFDPAAACAKTVRESAACRIAFQGSYQPPVDVGDFRSLYDGASLLGRPEHRAEFDFLLTSPRTTRLSAFPTDLPRDDRGRLLWLLSRLAELDMDVFAVDITTDEVRECGLWVVRVIIPQLVPMSSIQRARYLGHPRIYSYPGSAGSEPISEELVNPAPQPFA